MQPASIYLQRYLMCNPEFCNLSAKRLSQTNLWTNLDVKRNFDWNGLKVLFGLWLNWTATDTKFASTSIGKSLWEGDFFYFWCNFQSSKFTSIFFLGANTFNNFSLRFKISLIRTPKCHKSCSKSLHHQCNSGQPMQRMQMTNKTYCNI